MQGISGTSALPQMSSLQSASVAQDIINGKFSAEETLKIAEAVAQIPWATEADRDRILKQLVVEEPANKAGRRSQQNWLAMHNYFSAEQWSGFLDPAIPSEVKQTSIIAHLFRMGLRLPSEATMKWICSFWTLISTDAQELPRIDLMTKSLRLRNLKSKLESFRRKAEEPVQWVQTLPADPTEFCRDFKTLYTTAFAQSLPVRSEISVDLLTGFDMSYGCRGGLRSISTFGSPLRSKSTASSSGGRLVGTSDGEALELAWRQPSECHLLRTSLCCYSDKVA